MTTFTIDADNNITACAELPADATGEMFSSEKQLAKLTADWPPARLVETWNAFAGVVPFSDLKPVKKFTNRKTAVSRIWKTIQRLTDEPTQEDSAAPVVPQAAPVASKPKGPRKKATSPKKAATPRDGSKQAKVLDLMRRPQGVTLTEIMKATSWQAHTVRGFVSGTVGKKMGLSVESFRNDDKERAYRLPR